MKLLFEFFPILLFFLTYKFVNLYAATGVAMLAALGQVAWLKWRGQPIELMHWLSLGVITVFGGATLLLQDETFIKWKPSVLYWLFAALIAGALVMKRDPMKALLGAKMQLPDTIWRKVNLSWLAFFSVMGVVNIVIAYQFPTDVWVNFKVFGSMGLMLVFVLVQSLWLSRHMSSTEEQ